MSTQQHTLYEQVIAALLNDQDALNLLAQKRVGLEKESLRVNRQGSLLQDPHPATFGSALMHSQITTDYSEAQLELITPHTSDSAESLALLHALHAYIYRRMDESTLLWANSMPCVMSSGEHIPIAQYGHSNLGRMKHIYRQGLKLRYGSAMQVISGVHFNYSLHPDLWPFLKTAMRADTQSDFHNDCYMGMVRNLIRYGWMIPYLFGASPAVCRTFVDETNLDLQRFDETTLYEPHATSLRMGNVGYQNNKEIKTGLLVSHNSLAEYINSLRDAVSTPHPPYQALDNELHEHQQLSANILQIENEYYATVRPKRTALANEMSLLALYRAGIEYVEMRSLDVNPFECTGLSLSQLHFLEALFLFCLLTDSPPLTAEEQQQCSDNEIVVAHRGRDPQLRLRIGTASRPLSEWGEIVCQAMLPVCALLDKAHGGDDYQQALQAQRILFSDPTQILSAKILREMRTKDESFVAFVLRQSRAHQETFSAYPLTPKQIADWDALAEQSLAEQRRLEAADSEDINTYIARYFAQLSVLDQDKSA